MGNRPVHATWTVAAPALALQSASSPVALPETDLLHTPEATWVLTPATPHEATLDLSGLRTWAASYTDAESTALPELLKAHGAASLEERWPLLLLGELANPYRLAALRVRRRPSSVRLSDLCRTWTDGQDARHIQPGLHHVTLARSRGWWEVAHLGLFTARNEAPDDVVGRRPARRLEAGPPGRRPYACGDTTLGSSDTRRHPVGRCRGTRGATCTNVHRTGGRPLHRHGPCARPPWLLRPSRPAGALCALPTAGISRERLPTRIGLRLARRARRPQVRAWDLPRHIEVLRRRYVFMHGKDRRRAHDSNV